MPALGQPRRQAKDPCSQLRQVRIRHRDLQKNFVICVYSPWADEDAVRRHLTVLRSFGIEGRLSYKRDNETWVRSRGGNAWYWSPDGEELLLTRYAKEWKSTTREEATP